MATAAELLQEARYRKYRGQSPTDFGAAVAFMREQVKIQHPEKGAILFDLREAQLEALQVCMVERYVIILKARQLGWSTLMAVYCLWLAMFWPDQVIVMLSRTERDAHKLLAKSDYAYKRLPEWIRSRAATRLDRNVGKITFDNGSSIESLPSKEDPARGSAVSLVIVDEWAFLDNPEDAWASIEPITDVGGRCIGLSTANGSGNFFHQFWIKAVTKVSAFIPLFYAWFANTDRDDEWYEIKKANMPPWQLAQEYPKDPEEAFIKSGNPVFDVDRLRVLPIIEPECFTIERHPEFGIRSPQLRPHPDGVVSIWRDKEIDDAYVIGADVAEGFDYGDFSSAHVLSAKHNEVVATWHGHIDPDLFGEELAMLGYYYNHAFIGVEANNHGLSTNKALQRLSYPKLYARRRLDGRQAYRKQVDTIGWLTTKTSKPLMIDELARDFRAGLGIYDAATIGEMLTFVRNERGQMAGSPFDDRVISLAIANQMLPFARLNPQVDEPNYYMTFQYFLDKVKDPDPDMYVMGSNHRRH